MPTMCIHTSCTTRATLGIAGSEIAEFCAAHARAGMVNVVNRRCGEKGCSTRPSFGAAGSRKAEFCATHARAGMVNVVSKRCGKKGCSTRPSFGAAGSRKAEFCAAHARAGMVFVSSDECASQYHPNLVPEHGNSYRGGAHDLVGWSNLVEHIRGKTPSSDDFVTGETGVSIENGCKTFGPAPNAGPNTNDDGRNADSRCNPRVIRDGQRGANSTTMSLAHSREPPGPAAAGRVTIGRAEMRMKIKTEGTVAPARDFERIRSSKRIIAGSSSCDSMGLGASSRTTRSRSCANSITNGRKAKRLRRMAQVQPALDVAAGDDIMSKNDETDVKLDLIVSSTSRHLSAASSRLRKKKIE